MQISRYQDHDKKVHEGQDMTLLVMRAVPRSHPSASSQPVLADAVYHQVNVLKHTNQLLEAGHLPSGAAAMIIYGKAGKPLQDIDFYNKADSSKQFSLQKALEDMACEEAVRIAKEYGVLYTGSPLLDGRTLVAISDGQITSVLLTGWSDYANNISVTHRLVGLCFRRERCAQGGDGKHMQSEMPPSQTQRAMKLTSYVDEILSRDVRIQSNIHATPTPTPTIINIRQTIVSNFVTRLWKSRDSHGLKIELVWTWNLPCLGS
ncbi:hypothetical protein EV361DRAFT_885441 [Lentinula raphanica]|nr:hypothetical protein EV361DRAFT_885441 [Lentinula raphanica]